MHIYYLFSASLPSPPSPVSGFCPTGWEQMGSNCYLFDDSLMAASWSDARDGCQAKYGTDLASIHSSNEEDFIMQGVEAAFPGASVWLGMERSLCKLLTEVLFHWFRIQNGVLYCEKITSFLTFRKRCKQDC